MEIPKDPDHPIYGREKTAGNGFRSHTSDHRHMGGKAGSNALGEAKRELCLECVRQDFTKAYPDAGPFPL